MKDKQKRGSESEEVDKDAREGRRGLGQHGGEWGRAGPDVAGWDPVHILRGGQVYTNSTS